MSMDELNDAYLQYRSYPYQPRVHGERIGWTGLIDLVLTKDFPSSKSLSMVGCLTF